MRLGAAPLEQPVDPEPWIGMLRKNGYSTAVWPFHNAEADAVVRAYRLMKCGRA